MVNYVHKYVDVARTSSIENGAAIKLLYENRLYKNAIGILREELELYVKTLYLLNQSTSNRESLLYEFFQHEQWTNSRGRRLTDRETLDSASEITGFGWEQVSYKFACSFIHFSILHNWSNEDVTAIINPDEKRIIIQYINQYHGANLNEQSTFDDIIEYIMNIFEKIKENLECYLKDLENKD